MSVIRIGEIGQPGWLRGASADASAVRLHAGWRHVVRVTEETADLLLALLRPASVIALTLGLWRLAADLDWTETFPIPSGFFSHWQVWIVIAIGLNIAASFLISKTGENGRTSEEN